jgi:hypothetical protein
MLSTQIRQGLVVLVPAQMVSAWRVIAVMLVPAPPVRLTVAAFSPLLQVALDSPRVQMASPLPPLLGDPPVQVVGRLSSMFQTRRWDGLLPFTWSMADSWSNRPGLGKSLPTSGHNLVCKLVLLLPRPEPREEGLQVH